MLPDGLRLRPARPSDLDQIAALLVERGEEGDDVDHRLVVQDPDAGWETSAVVVDGDRVVSTATLLDETVRVGDVHLPAGQVELVATAEEYEGRGLARALMGWAHELSTARGHLLQVMIGIPYFYRLFGYEYAIDIPRARRLVDPPPAAGIGGPASPDTPVSPAAVTPDTSAAPGTPSAPDHDRGAVLRRATPADLPALTALQDHAQAGYDVAVPHSAPRRRWLLAHPSSTTWVLERDGAAVATVRLREDDDSVLVAESAALDAAAADDLLRAVAAEHPARPLTVVHRPGTQTGRSWEPRLAPADELAEQYYVRIPRAEPVLAALLPVLQARLAASGLDRAGREIVLSTFAAHVRIPVADDGTLGTVRTGGRLPWPASVGGAGVAPDQLPALLLGPLGMHGLARRRPDVYPGPDAELFDALFPPLTADVLSYYLPW